MEQIPKDFYLHFRVDLPVARHLYGHPAKLISKFTGRTSVPHYNLLGLSPQCF